MAELAAQVEAPTPHGAVGAHRERGVFLFSDVDAAAQEVRETAEGQIETVTLGFEGGSRYVGPLSTILTRFRKQAPR